MRCFLLRSKYSCLEIWLLCPRSNLECNAMAFVLKFVFVAGQPTTFLVCRYNEVREDTSGCQEIPVCARVFQLFPSSAGAGEYPSSCCYLAKLIIRFYCYFLSLSRRPVWTESLNLQPMLERSTVQSRPSSRHK